MTLGVRREETSPELTLCVDHLPKSLDSNRPRAKRYSHVFWALPSKDGQAPGVVSVDFKDLESRGSAYEKDLEGPPVKITVTYPHIMKVDLIPASSPFHEKGYVEEYNKILAAFRDVGESVSYERKDAMTISLFTAPWTDDEVAELDNFKARCGDIFPADHDLATKSLGSSVRTP